MTSINQWLTLIGFIITILTQAFVLGRKVGQLSHELSRSTQTQQSFALRIDEKFSELKITLLTQFRNELQLIEERAKLTHLILDNLKEDVSKLHSNEAKALERMGRRIDAAEANINTLFRQIDVLKLGVKE